jgi:hypothetical protein
MRKTWFPTLKGNIHKISIAGLLMVWCLFANDLPFSNKANASEVTMGFFAVDHGNAHLAPIDACTLSNHETASGFILGIGPSTGIGDEIVRFLSCSPTSSPGTAVEVRGTFKMLAANGDEIDGEYTTTGTLDPVNGASFQGGFTFTSGTGRFIHARGSGVVAGHGAPNPPFDFVASWTGILSYGDDD